MIYVEELRIAKRVLKNIKVGNFIFQLLRLIIKIQLLNPSLCNPMDYRQPGSSVHGIFQAISFSRGSSDPGVKLASPALTGGLFTTDHLRSPYYAGR